MRPMARFFQQTEALVIAPPTPQASEQPFGARCVGARDSY